MNHNVRSNNFLVTILELLVTLAWVTSCRPERTLYAQTCSNCKASSRCFLHFDRFITDVAHCREECLAYSINQCNMGEVEAASGECRLYDSCIGVGVAVGYTTVRRTCVADCLDVELTKYSEVRGTCMRIGIKYTSEEVCVTSCLDTEGCRGVTYIASSTECLYHTCDSVVDSIGTIFVSLKCTGSATRTTPSPPTAKTLTIALSTITEATSMTSMETSFTSASPVSFISLISSANISQTTSAKLTAYTAAPLLATEKANIDTFFDKLSDKAKYFFLGGVLLIAGCSVLICICVLSTVKKSRKRMAQIRAQPAEEIVQQT